MNTEQNYSGEQVFTNTLEPTATPQPPTAPTAAQPRPSLDERQAGESPQPSTGNPVTLRPSALDFQLGDQAHQLFFALTAQLRSLAQDTVVDFDPNDLPSHLRRWDELEDLLDLLTGLFTKTNWYAEELTDHLRNIQNPGWRKGANETYAHKFDFWARKAQYHPGLSEEGGVDA